MIKIISLEARRDYTNRKLSSEGHWVKLVFENDYGVHTLELNGRTPLPNEPELRDALDFLLFDYGLLEQQESKTPQQRVKVAKRLMNIDGRNHLLARAYMMKLGAPIH